jgi:predicted metalloprotease with PDZ domain
MSEKLSIKVFVWLILISLFAMYQQTEAQQKPANRPRKQTAAAKPLPPEIAFTVSMRKPWTHLLEIEMQVRWENAPEKTELKMPVWTPGSYLIREYSRHVQQFSVRDAGGKALPWTKINKNTWQIETKGVKDFTASYKVYSNELTVRTNELNHEHAFWNNTALLFYIKDHLNVPATVRVEPYGNWRVATGLPAVPGSENTFRAENFDILYDSPFEVSDFREIRFVVRGKEHRYVVTGDGNYDLERLAADTSKIIEECYKIFGELPYENYLFIVNTRGSGGLEHMNSTALQVNRFAFGNETRYKNFLRLVAHEFFHLWNVKRIRPDVLGPFDYENENYTRLLWVAEGATAYYEGVILMRAGLISADEMLDAIAGLITQLQNRPGRFETSLEESSFDAWIKYYRQDENAVNNQISYYDKGEIVSFLLDISIRAASDGKHSLDDVFRYLNDEFAKKGRNYSSADFQSACERYAGRSLEDIFSKYVRGRDEIDYAAITTGIGLQSIISEPHSRRAYIGADMVDDAGRVLVRSVPAGTPAYEQGLNAGDQIVAVDGHRASQAFLTQYIGEKRPGDKVKLSFFRHDRLREMEFTLGPNTRKEFIFIAVDQPTEQQRRLYQQYFGRNL